MIAPRVVTRPLCAALIVVVLFCRSAGGAAPSILVAAASDLQTVMPTLAAQFLKASGSEIRATYGSSGNFFTQIQNGAPFDLFLSADIEYPRRLEVVGLAEPQSLVTYGFGRIVERRRRATPRDRA